jgi:hypothetical protein
MAGDEVKRTNKNMEAIYNPSTPEAEAGESQIQGQLGLYITRLCSKKKKKKM